MNAKHTNGAVNALMAYRQADEEEIMVLVSRQAIHEVVEQHAELLDALEDLNILAELALVQANKDGAEWLIGEELEVARAAIAKAKGEGQ